MLQAHHAFLRWICIGLTSGPSFDQRHIFETSGIRGYRMQRNNCRQKPGAWPNLQNQPNKSSN